MANNLFDVNATVAAPSEDTQSANEFRPHYKKGMGGVFEAYIRFLPNPKDPANGSVVSKYSAFIKNFANNQTRVVDCPSSVGEQDPIQEAFFALRKSSNPAQVEASKSFSRSARYASLVQIINCPADATLNGKVLVWNYGKKIYDKIQAEINPGNKMITPRNPFNMIQGRPFYVKCKEVSGFNNFDESMFFDPKEPIYVYVNFNNVPTPVTAESISQPGFPEAVNTWLNASAPSLEPYKYQPWTDEVRQFVSEAIASAMNPQVLANAANNVYGTGFANPATPAAPGAMNPGAMASGPVNIPGLNLGGGMPGMNTNPAMAGIGATPAPAAMPSMPSMPSMPTMGATPAPATTPGGFAASNIPNVDDAINANPVSAAPTQAAAPAGGLSLGDVLGDII